MRFTIHRKETTMKTTRLLLAALALALAAACSSADITGPSDTSDASQTAKGQQGSGT
jgi:outer membrane biogenesis lipoprotein LolB